MYHYSHFRDEGMEAKKDQTTCQALRVIVSDSQVSQSQGRLCPSLFNQKEQPVFHQLIVTVLLSAMFPHWLSWAWWKQGNVTCQFFLTLVLVPVHVWEHKGLLAVCSCMFQASWSLSFQESSCFSLSSPHSHCRNTGIAGVCYCVWLFNRFWDLNSRPFTCMACILPTDSFPSPVRFA